MRRGRPFASPIRQNIVELLYYVHKSTGYDLYKLYVKHFPKCSQRSIYYHLSVGVNLGEFEIQKVVDEKGEYSWGKSSQKIYYELGKNAKPQIIPSLSNVLDHNS